MSALHSGAWRIRINTSNGEEFLDQDFEEAHTVNAIGANADSFQFPAASFLEGWRRGRNK